MVMPHSLAEAWAEEATLRGATSSTPGYDDAQNLFYAGAAAMLAMTAAAGKDGTLNLLLTIKAELQEYVGDA